MCKKTGQQLSECKTLFPHFVDEEHEDQEGNRVCEKTRSRWTMDVARQSQTSFSLLIPFVGTGRRHTYEVYLTLC